MSHCKQIKNAMPRFEKLGEMFPVPVYSAFHTVGVDILEPFPKMDLGWNMSWWPLIIVPNSLNQSHKWMSRTKKYAMHSSG